MIAISQKIFKIYDFKLKNEKYIEWNIKFLVVYIVKIINNITLYVKNSIIKIATLEIDNKVELILRLINFDIWNSTIKLYEHICRLFHPPSSKPDT